MQAGVSAAAEEGGRNFARVAFSTRSARPVRIITEAYNGRLLE